MGAMCQPIFAETRSISRLQDRAICSSGLDHEVHPWLALMERGLRGMLRRHHSTDNLWSRTQSLQVAIYCANKGRRCRVARLVTSAPYTQEELNMLSFVLGVVLGAVVAFIGPSLLPQQFRSAYVDSALRVI